MAQDEQKPQTIEGLENTQSVEAEADGERSYQEALATKVEECKSLNDRYVRLAAEFENYKRLAQRDQRDQIRYGNEQILKELLPVVDNMERAIKAATDSGGGGSALIQGVDLTLKQLVSALGKFGVQPIESVGQPFDPTLHQAVSQIPSESVPEQHVAQEYQKGYRLHDRILRAAMVGVSSGRPSSDTENTAAN
jgi:molecular chaperone GrpE